MKKMRMIVMTVLLLASCYVQAKVGARRSDMERVLGKPNQVILDNVVIYNLADDCNVIIVYLDGISVAEIANLNKLAWSYKNIAAMRDAMGGKGLWVLYHSDPDNKALYYKRENYVLSVDNARFTIIVMDKNHQQYANEKLNEALTMMMIVRGKK